MQSLLHSWPEAWKLSYQQLNFDSHVFQSAVSWRRLLWGSAVLYLPETRESNHGFLEWKHHLSIALERWSGLLKRNTQTCDWHPFPWLLVSISSRPLSPPRPVTSGILSLVLPLCLLVAIICPSCPQHANRTPKSHFQPGHLEKSNTVPLSWLMHLLGFPRGISALRSDKLNSWLPPFLPSCCMFSLSW